MKTRRGDIALSLLAALLLATVLALAPAQAAADDTAIFLTAGGWQREYIVHLPKKSPKTPMPVVIFFHGAGGSAAGAARDYGWEEKADQAQFLAVFPQGLPAVPSQPASFAPNPNIWRDGRPDMPTRAVDDDVFFRQMLGDIKKRYPVDRRRIYVTGFSNGAGMTFHLGATFSDRIAAIAPVASHLFGRFTSLKRPVPMLYIIGTQDPLNPMAGGDVRMPWGGIKHSPPVMQSIEAWRTLDGCPALPKLLRDDHGGVHCLTYGPGAQGSEVVYYTLDGMGHHWPGSIDHLPAWLIGRPSNEIDATVIIWNFFTRHRSPK